MSGASHGSNECDVCNQSRPSGTPRDPVVTTMILGEHVVMLCRGHRWLADERGVETFEQLRALFGETDGRRSHVPRRDHTGGRLRGRRATDALPT